MKRKIYIAYGSNMSEEQMQFRCPDSKLIGTGKIKNFRLMFKGSLSGNYATIEPEENFEVTRKNLTAMKVVRIFITKPKLKSKLTTAKKFSESSTLCTKKENSDCRQNFISTYSVTLTKNFILI